MAQQPEAETQWDQAMPIPSPKEIRAWFPDLAVDSQDRVHVVWNVTGDLGVAHLGGEAVFYSMWDGQQWLPFNDIVVPEIGIVRHAIAIDDHDTLHFAFGWHEMYYKQALSNEASSAAAWTLPTLINSRNGTYMKDIVAYQDTLHVLYDDFGAGDEEGECPQCADIFYRRSPDRGLTWSVPVALFPTDHVGSARVQMEIDRTGTIYVTWDEGWDRLSGHETAQKSGVYMYSTDGGHTWSRPSIISYPNSSNVQLTVGSNSQGGVMLVWRTRSLDYPGIYYMWSVDYGESWSPPQTLSNILVRNMTTPFDKYDMATDSAGHIHLLVVGHLSSDPKAEKPPGLYHFEWDGNAWSAPSPLYEESWYPEYPHLVVHRGNQLHATWFVRQAVFDETEPHQIWYAHGQSSAPVETPIPRPTSNPSPTSMPTTPTPTPVPTLTPRPTPTLDPDLAKVSVSSEAATSIYTETDELLLLAKSLIPAILIIVVVVVGIRLWRR
jgi:hypothetical protein